MPLATNVSAGKPRVSGAIFRAPLGTDLPISATAALSAEYKDLGFVSDAGITNNNTADTENVYAWGGTPVLNIINEKPDEWTLKLIESLNPNVLNTIYGDDNVAVDLDNKSIQIKATAADIPDAVYVFDIALKGGALKRIVIPIGSLGEVGEIVYKDDEPIGYEITIKAMDDGKATHYEYIKLP